MLADVKVVVTGQMSWFDPVCARLIGTTHRPPGSGATVHTPPRRFRAPCTREVFFRDRVYIYGRCLLRPDVKTNGMCRTRMLIARGTPT